MEKFAVILLMAVLLIVGIFLFREEIQKAVAGIPLLVRISFSGWIGIGLVLALVVLAASERRSRKAPGGQGVFLCPGFHDLHGPGTEWRLFSPSLFSCEPGIHALFHGLSLHGGSGDQGALRLDLGRSGAPLFYSRRHGRRMVDLEVFSRKNGVAFLLAQNLTNLCTWPWPFPSALISC